MCLHDCEPYQVKVTVTSDVSGLSAEETIDIYVKLSGDVDGNGVVNVLDKVQVRNHFGESVAILTGSMRTWTAMVWSMSWIRSM